MKRTPPTASNVSLREKIMNTETGSNSSGLSTEGHEKSSSEYDGKDDDSRNNDYPPTTPRNKIKPSRPTRLIND